MTNHLISIHSMHFTFAFPLIFFFGTKKERNWVPKRCILGENLTQTGFSWVGLDSPGSGVRALIVTFQTFNRMYMYHSFIQDVTCPLKILGKKFQVTSDQGFTSSQCDQLF